MKNIVLYYSKNQKTAEVAKTLCEELETDIIEIKDSKPRNGILDYVGASIDAFRENKTKISPSRIDLNPYNIIYIGSPVWAGKPVPAILSLIDNCNFHGKDVILFVTYGASGGDGAIKRMNEKIELRGGRIINSFSIKTGGKGIQKIKNETKKTIKEIDLKIYDSSIFTKPKN